MSSESILSLGWTSKIQKPPWWGMRQISMNSEKYRSSSEKKEKKKKKGIGFQVNEKKITWFLTDIVEKGSNSKNKCSYTKNTL